MVRRNFNVIEQPIHQDSATDVLQAMLPYEVSTAKSLKSIIYIVYPFYCFFYLGDVQMFDGSPELFCSSRNKWCI